jgi:Flp pilus assembly protein TadG
MDATQPTAERPPTRRRWRVLRDDRGSILIEFALVGPIFLMLMLGIIELGIMLFAQTVLDGAARSAARMIRTGQVQANATPQTAFQTALCNGMRSLMPPPCSAVIYDVEVYPSFGAISPPRTNGSGQFVDASGNPITAQFVPGSNGSIVVVKAVYQRSFVSGYARQYLGYQSTNGQVLSSTVVFQNEP